MKEIEEQKTLLVKESISKGFKFKMYARKTIKKRLWLTALASVLMAVGYTFFIQKADVFNTGTSGFSIGLSKILCASLGKPNLFMLFYWLLYVLTNLPLVIFSYLKIGKKFTSITLMNILLSSALGLFMSYTPGLKDFNIFKMISDESIRKISYTIIGGFIYAFGVGLVFVSGASAGGTDFIATYYSAKRNKPLGPLLLVIGLSTLAISVFMGEFLAKGIEGDWSFYNMMNLEMVLSILFMVMTTMIVNRVYPKNRKVSINVVTNKPEEIFKKLVESGYKHSITESTARGMYSKQERTLLFTVCTFIEHLSVISIIAEIDKNAFVVTEQVQQITGPFYIQDVD